MTTLLLHAGRAVTPAAEISDAGILIHDGTIEAVGPRQALRLPPGEEEIREPEAIAIPGFVDVHFHGAGGSDVMEGTRQAIGTVARTIAEHGTTSFLATTVTASAEDTSRSIEGISHYIEHQHEEDAVRSEVLGIHFEGPFLSPTRRGVHPQEWLQLPSVELLARFLKVARGTARLLTIAPELPGAPSCIEAAHTARLVVAIGHTYVNYEQTRAAIARGVRHPVHVYNAVRPVTHREPGVDGARPSSPRGTAEIVSDGGHLADGAMRLLLQAKGVERVILVSDGTVATGLAAGKYK